MIRFHCKGNALKITQLSHYLPLKIFTVVVRCTIILTQKKNSPKKTLKAQCCHDAHVHILYLSFNMQEENKIGQRHIGNKHCGLIMKGNWTDKKKELTGHNHQ